MSIGAQLRASREARGLSIDAVAHTTRVQPRILAAIERDDVSGVPPRPFGRGFVKAYAREIGLDGDQTTRDYFAQFMPVATPAPAQAETPTASRAASPARLAPLALASIGVVAAIVIAIVISRPAATNESSVAAKAVGTSGSATAAAAVAARSTDAAPVIPAPASAAPVAPPVSAAPLTIVLTATSPSWVTADADGHRAVYRTITPGSPETVTAKREIVIRVGNAGAMSWRINGREAGTMGRPGQIRDLTVTPKTAATIR